MIGAARRPFALVLGLAGLLVSVVVTFVTGDLPAGGTQEGLGVVAAFAVAIVLGEWFLLSAPGFRGSAPMAMASAFGLALTTEIPEGHFVSYGAAFVLAVSTVAMTVGPVVSTMLASRPTASCRGSRPP